MRSHNFKQLIKEITRPLSKSCLDHVWCTHPEHLNNATVLSSGMSDHLPIVVTRKYMRVRNKNSEHITITYRNIGRLDKESFIAALKEAPWDCAFVFENINDVVDAWYKLFNSVLDEYLPQIQKRVKREVQPKWFSNEISQEIKKRDMLLKKARKSQTESDWSEFKRVKNKVTELIRDTKSNYFKQKVSESKNNTKKLWNLIKCLSKDDADRRAVITNLTENAECICDQKTIAEILNNFFVEQPQNLTADLENATLLHSLPTIGQNSSEFEIPFISQKDVAEILLSIPSHKTTDNDGISAKLLKIAAPGIIPSLTKLLNHCLHTKTFPNVWKVAKVTPVFKGNGRKDDKNNYRPISVLPVLNKVDYYYYYYYYYYLPSFTVIYRYLLSFTVIYCHSLSSTLIYCHSPSFTVIYCHLLSFTVIYCHLLSFTVINCHLMSFTVIHCH